MSLGPSHVSYTLPQISKEIAKKSGKNAKVSIQKIYAYWNDIIGTEFADKSIPYHISWSKHSQKKKQNFMPMGMVPLGKASSKNKTKQDAPKSAEKIVTATLHILASSAVSTKIMYQEHLIIERISRILGHQMIQNIQIKHESGLDNTGYGYKIPKKLNVEERAYLDDVLENIEDKTLKQRLYSIGEKILLDNAP